MALIVLCSAKGSPGVTATALAFTLTWNRRIILAECDAAGGDICAGYLRDVRLDGHGLGRLTASLARRRLAEDLWTQLVDLAPGERTAMTRLMLPGLSDPAQAVPWTERRAPGQPSGWEQLATLLRSAEGGSSGYDVIVDYGRLSTANAPAPLLAAADAILLVLRPTLPAVRAAAVAVAGLIVPAGAQVGLLTVGEGLYGSKELALELRTPVVAALPDDPRTADVLSNGGERSHGRLLRYAARAEAEIWQMVDTGRAARSGRARPGQAALLGRYALPADRRGNPWEPDSRPSVPPGLAAAVRAQINGHALHPPQVTPASAARAPQPPVAPPDDAVVRALHERAAQLLAAEFRNAADVSPEDRRAIGEDISAQVVRAWVDGRREAGERVSDEDEQLLLDAVLAYLFGLGRLQAITEDPDVENVMVMGHKRVRVEYADGRIEEGPLAAQDDRELLQMIQRIAVIGQRNERALTVSKPTLNMRLPTGNRLAAMHVVTPVPVVVTRRHRTKKVNLDDMVALGAIDPVLRQFLAALVRADLNVIIAGPPNSGKTTLMRAMATEIPQEEWFATMETEYELGLHETGEFPWVVPIEAREGHGDLGPDGRPAGEVSLERIFPDMLRLSMTRVLVGEVRSSEIVPMFDAMNTMRGSMCTLHVRHPDGVLLRLAELLMRYGAADTLTGAWLTVVNALDYIVYVDMVNETARGGQRHRFVSHVIEIDGLGDGATPSTQTVFGPGADGRARPRVHPQRTRAALQRTGFDLQWLNVSDGMWQHPLRTLTEGQP